MQLKTIRSFLPPAKMVACPVQSLELHVARNQQGMREPFLSFVNDYCDEWPRTNDPFNDEIVRAISSKRRRAVFQKDKSLYMTQVLTGNERAFIPSFVMYTVTNGLGLATFSTTLAFAGQYPARLRSYIPGRQGRKSLYMTVLGVKSTRIRRGHQY
ncbi:hypothetical protein C8J56DRAFT_126855 [Mycena floridula]|nr:hypothetical protein C8J56DRAFT_126855 [Mycena floridula]